MAQFEFPKLKKPYESLNEPSQTKNYLMIS